MHDHTQAIAWISQKHFATPPGRITRMGNGICNEVYAVEVGEQELIFRMKDAPRYLLGSHNHIPVFRSKGIPVPEIVAEDYSKTELALAYQVQTKTPGRDINDVIATLSDDELRAIGGEIANVFRQLKDVPNNGKYGVLWGDEKDLIDTWTENVTKVTGIVIGWGRRTGVIEPEFEDILKWINQEYKGYFDRVPPITYFGDLSSKNVMIHQGRFAGLVDLDSLAQGDPLEAVGRIKASWYGTHHGEVYSTALMDSLGLSDEHRRIVTMYALMNRTFWTFENGVQFNQNTSSVVDRERERKDKLAVRDLWNELQAARHLAKPQINIDSPSTYASTDSQLRSTEIVASAAHNVDLPSPSDGNLRSIAATTTPAEQQQTAVAPPTSRTVVLEALGLSKTYVSDGIGFDALGNVDLKIGRGECVAIVGKSGSGKSTLMHLLACLDAPTEGFVYVDGDDTSEMSESLKNVLRNEQFGFVFQQFFLNGRDTVFENVVLPMRIRGSSQTELEMAAAEALEAVGLADKIDKKAKDLSGGEKQRVCIARALITKPKVIFADEPTGNLDSATGAAVEQLLFDLNREKGITLVIVTHDPDLAEKCDRIIEMKDGHILADTNVAEARA